MRKPSIHLNGSDPQSLFDDYYAALQSVHAAKEALAKCAPNGRDYYVQWPTPGIGRDAASEAMDEHRARMAAMTKIELELQRLAEHVMEVGGDKVRS